MWLKLVVFYSKIFFSHFFSVAVVVLVHEFNLAIQYHSYYLFIILIILNANKLSNEFSFLFFLVLCTENIECRLSEWVLCSFFPLVFFFFWWLAVKLQLWWIVYSFIYFIAEDLLWIDALIASPSFSFHPI